MTVQGDASSAPATVKPSGRSNRIRPIEAMRALAHMSDNPEDTHRIYQAEIALRGNSGVRLLRRFVKTPVGASVVQGQRQLMEVMSDEAALARLPEGSLGRAYLDFMSREDLSVKGLTQAFPDDDMGAGPGGQLLRDRIRDMHDLTHVLTGYGRDILGEICLLTVMYRQTGNRCYAAIVLLTIYGFLKAGRNRKAAGADLVARGAVAMARKALFESYANGRKGAWLPGVDWEALLAEDLTDLRRRLNIPPPTSYMAVMG